MKKIVLLLTLVSVNTWFLNAMSRDESIQNVNRVVLEGRAGDLADLFLSQDAKIIELTIENQVIESQIAKLGREVDLASQKVANYKAGVKKVKKVVIEEEKTGAAGGKPADILHRRKSL